MKYVKEKDGIIVKKQTYSKKIMLGLNDIPSKGHLLQILTIPPRDFSIKERFHFHNKQTEVYYVLEGEAEVFLNSEKFDATPGDVFVVEPGDKHHIMNRSKEDFKFVVFKIDLPESDEDTFFID